ncbi:MAG: TIR domain-containing protein [Acidimicrobiia bacterium]|nr:TIR domain-containing protein [Acidimicrobiia bacterium]
MTMPTVFISHRHADKDIAQTVAEFIDRHSGGRAKVFCSSSKDFEGVVAGQTIEGTLKQALAASDLVLLIFTVATEDWSYCMYECGLATDPTDQKETRVVVLQCGAIPPKPYVDHLSVELHDLESITRFVRTFLTGTEYFPKRGEPLTGFQAQGPQVTEFAAELHQNLAANLARLDVEEAKERPASTYLCIELDRDALDELQSEQGQSDEDAVRIVRDRARVVGKSYAHALFGFLFDATTTLGRVVDEWTADHPGAGSPALPAWFGSLVKQVRAVAAGKIQEKVDWAPYRAEPGEAIIPFVAGSRTVPSTGGLQLHVYFMPMSPRPVPVVERMIPLDVMFHRNLAETPGDTIKLLDLRAEMEANARSRVPMLGEEGRARFIVHRSMIDAFLVRSLATANSEAMTTARDLTVHDLLVDPTNETVRTFAVVDPSADMDQALAVMRDVPGCQDVFVTTDGTEQSAVVGWLTNTLFL